MIQQVLNACSPQGPHQVRTDLPGKINTMRGRTPASQRGCASAGQPGGGGRLEGADSSSTAVNRQGLACGVQPPGENPAKQSGSPTHSRTHRTPGSSLGQALCPLWSSPVSQPPVTCEAALPFPPGLLALALRHQ